MEFFVYHRDRVDSEGLREEMIEEHWAYMDRFEKELIARGPTFDGERLAGSVHIVDLPGPAEVRAFAFDEPCYQAGAYRDVLIRRWHDLLGRTMWEFPGERTAGHRYLVLGIGGGPAAADLTVPAERADLIAYGPLLSDDGRVRLGTALLAVAPDPESARALLTGEWYADIEVYGWEFGGRR